MGNGKYGDALVLTRAGVGQELVTRVQRLVLKRLGEIAASICAPIEAEQLTPGKLLRTRLAARLLQESDETAGTMGIVEACAATEMVHTASLCHDDVIDNGLLRRGKPAFWRTAGARGAILVGDLLLCEAMRMLLPAVDGSFVTNFIAKVSEAVSAETEQELMLRGGRTDVSTCLRLARSKTGPLFALTAGISRWHDEDIRPALEEAGYRIGTAYQIADDVLDTSGRETEAGKTLGTDMRRRKITLPATSPEGKALSRDLVVELLESSLEVLDEWPQEKEAVAEFLEHDLRPVIDFFVTE